MGTITKGIQRWFRGGALFALSSGLAGLAGCVAPPPPPDPTAVRVGALLPFTGTNATSGTNIERALILAAENIDAAGGIGHHTLHLISADTHSSADRGFASAKRLFDQEKVDVLLGPEDEDLAQRLVVELKRHRLVGISGGVVSPRFTTADDEDFFFRTIPSGHSIGRAIAERLIADGVRRAALVHSSDEYGTGMSNVIVSEFGARGGDTGLPIVIEPGQTNFRSLINIVMSKQPQAVVLLAPPQVAAAVLHDWAALGGAVRWYTGLSLESQAFLDNAPPDLVQGLVGFSPAVRDTTGRFKTLFEQRWLGEKPSLGAYFYYDALAVWALAAESVFTQTGEGPTAASVRAQMRRVSGPDGEEVSWDELPRAFELIRAGKEINYQGASGAVDLNEWGEPATGEVRAWTIREGRIVDW